MVLKQCYFCISKFERIKTPRQLLLVEIRRAPVVVREVAVVVQRMEMLHVEDDDVLRSPRRHPWPW